MITYDDMIAFSLLEFWRIVHQRCRDTLLCILELGRTALVGWLNIGYQM